MRQVKADSTQTPETMEALPQEVLSRLDALASNLGVGLEHLWEILVRQAYVDAVQFGAVWLVVVFTCGFAWAKRETLLRAVEEDEDFMGFCAFLFIPALVAALLVSTAIAISVIPTALLNPEFYALEQIGELLSK